MFSMSVYSTIQMDKDVNVPTLEGGSSRRERPLYSSGSHLHAEYTLQIVINIGNMEFMLSTTAEAFIFKLSCSNAEVSCRTAH